MGITIGPVDWWLETPDSLTALVSSCPVGTILPDKSALICKAGGVAWIVAPVSTQVSSTWNGSTTTQVGTRCCVCDWPTLCERMISCGFNPSDWFVPSQAQLQNPGFICRSRWDSYSTTNCSAFCYWNSNEISAVQGCVTLMGTVGNPYCGAKTAALCVRAFRCVTY